MACGTRPKSDTHSSIYEQLLKLAKSIDIRTATIQTAFQILQELELRMSWRWGTGKGDETRLGDMTPIVPMTVLIMHTVHHWREAELHHQPRLDIVYITGLPKGEVR